MAATKYAILLALMTGAVVAQVSRPGQCPNKPVVNPFDVGRYLGKWYQIEAYFQAFSANAICVAANYSDLGNGTVKVYNTNFDATTLNFNYIEGTARLTNGTSAQLGVSFPVTPVEAPYWVLETDYDNFAVVWSCRNSGSSLYFETAWFLARERQPNNTLVEQVRNIFKERFLSTEDLIPTRQYDCPPEPSPAH